MSSVNNIASARLLQSHNTWPLTVLTLAKSLSSTWKTYPQHLLSNHTIKLNTLLHFFDSSSHISACERGRTRHCSTPKGRRLLSHFRMCRLLSTPMSPLLRNESIDLG